MGSEMCIRDRGLNSLLHEVFPGLVVSTAMYLAFSKRVDNQPLGDAHEHLVT